MKSTTEDMTRRSFAGRFGLFLAGAVAAAKGLFSSILPTPDLAPLVMSRGAWRRIISQAADPGDHRFYDADGIEQVVKEARSTPGTLPRDRPLDSYPPSMRKLLF